MLIIRCKKQQKQCGSYRRRPAELDDDVEAAEALLAKPDVGVIQIAHRFDVSPVTLYRYIPTARAANLPDREVS